MTEEPQEEVSTPAGPPADDSIPPLKRILGALIFAANRPLSVKEMRQCLNEVAEESGGRFATYAKLKDHQLWAALEELMVDVDKVGAGFMLAESAGGLRYHSDAACGTWVRHMLGAGRPTRLSRPSLETLAIIAYRQPITRAEMEAVRGVNVDHVIRLLMEMQLVKIVGRSELPGKPFQYGTTNAFLEHFGLKGIEELGKIDPSLLAEREAKAAKTRAPAQQDLPGTGADDTPPPGDGEASEPEAVESTDGADESEPAPVKETSDGDDDDDVEEFDEDEFDDEDDEDDEDESDEDDDDKE